MKIKWYGHASFLITGLDGTSIITDPYTPQTAGYAPITDEPDIVIISSATDSFHCRADLIPGNPTVINALDIAKSGGKHSEKGVTFSAIQAMEALDHPEHDPDQNGMYKFTVDGLTVGHMGDIGNALSDSQIAFFGDVDILLALAGGLPTIALDDLKILIDKTAPRLVIPMHFRTLRYRPRNTFWIETFLHYFDENAVDFACNYQVELSPDSLPTTTRLLILTHAN